MANRTLSVGALLALTVSTLAACSAPPLEEKDRATVVAQCEKSMAKRSSTPEQANQMCGCTADKLIAENMSAMGMISKRGMEIMDECAKAAGMNLAAPEPAG